MDKLKVVKSPTCIKGKTFKFGAVYGKIDGIVYVVESFNLDELNKGILTFEFYNEKRIIHTKKHGSYVRGGYWQKCSSLEKGRYGNIVSTVIDYIINNQLYLTQPTPYIRNTEIRANGAPKRKLPQNEMVYKLPHKSYTLSPNIMTEMDADRRIRPGVTYFPA